MTDKGTLFVFSGPSGTGKGTILSKFYEMFDDGKIKYSVSATTRIPRPGETEGINYYFKTKQQFESMIKNDELLEWAQFCDNFYGTPKNEVMNMINNGIDVILEIETVGALNVKAKYPEAVMVFVLPPSLEELKRRLIGRGTETPETLEKRFTTAEKELELVQKYDYIIVNNDIDKAAKDFKVIVNAERLKVEKNKNTISEVCKK